MFKNLFTVPDRLQIAALCYRVTNRRLEVLLVTTRDSGRWILPKGWPMMKKKGHRTAVIEAFEEAGVIGEAPRKEPYAQFASHKGVGGGLKVDTDVLVYLVEAKGQAETFPEAGERQLRWLSVDEAIALTDEEGARPILRQFLEEMRQKGRCS
ncbi:NUDIX hydrolase [Roseibium aestuarii]|uniref:NUDIX hydrolase n=1 Tax=Roseibium aestuarii TaxID=2600299 RepID=A0ABW4JRH7_9HYPH|nr:NUDIX hydrolase [Roseibium aestuarii]